MGDVGDDRYNGWTNRATWCAALWISSDEGLYLAARGGADPVDLLADHAEFRGDLDPDGMSDVDWGEVKASIEDE